MTERQTQHAGGSGDDPEDHRLDDDARRLENALDKAARYSDERQENSAPKETADTPPPPALMSEWSDLVSQRVEDAMRRGLFDNLSGKGKPLDLERNPYVPADQQMTMHLLKNHDLVPEWIAARREVLDTRDRLRAELKQGVEAIRKQMDSADAVEERARLNQAWKRWLNGWYSRMEDLNYRIMIQNLKQPVRHLEIYQLLLRDELVRAGADAAWQFDLR